MMLMLVTCRGLHELCGLSEMFWGLLSVPSSTEEVGNYQQTGQEHKTPQYLTGAFSWGMNHELHLGLGENIPLHGGQARLCIWELCFV